MHTTHTSAEQGETPILVVVSILIFALFALAAGPAIHSISKANADTAVDRRLDKALAVALDSERRQGWNDLQPHGPQTSELNFEDFTLPLTTWVEQLSDIELRVTKAVPLPMTDAQCDHTTPTHLPQNCVTRSAKVAATSSDFPAVTSPEIVFTDSAYELENFEKLNTGADLFEINVTKPMKVSLVYRTPEESPTFHVDYADVTRATILTNRTPGTPEDNDWRFGNVIVCPNWATGSPNGAQMQVRLPAQASDIDVAQALVITTPVANSKCS